MTNNSGDYGHWHLLRPVKGECVPQRVIVFQVAPLRRRIDAGLYEDTLLCGHARCYWLSDGEVIREQFVDFGRAEQLWGFIGRYQIKDRCTWVFGHSLGYQLTLLDFWRRLDSATEHYLWAVLSDPPTIVCTRRGSRVVKYVDTVNYFREPLPSLLGGRDGWSGWALDPGAPVYDHIAWCRRVSKALGELICRMIRIVRQELRCTWQCTAASLSWSLYRHWYLSEPVWIHHHEETSRLETDSLYGGLQRVSSLGSVSSPTYAWDVNSLYPYVMATEQIPNKLIRYYHEPPVPLLHHHLGRHYCVADVRVEIPPYEIPYRSDKLAGYSRAAGRYVLCGAELIDAARDGMVCACYRLGAYETGDLFRSFVLDIYPRKLAASEQGDLAARWLWKICLNGLSGKFAQRARRWTDAKEIISPGRWCYWWHRGANVPEAIRCRSVAGQSQKMEKGGFKRNAMPMVTASITSAARSRMRALIALAPSSECLYCDCDSIHTGQRGSDALVASGHTDPVRLGALKLVVSGTDAYYWALKHYRIGDYYVSNVVQLGARKMDDGYWLQNTKRGLECTLQSGVLDRVIVREQEVRINGTCISTRPSVV